MDPSSLYSSGPTNGSTDPSSNESLKRKRGTNSKSQSRSKSNTPTPSSTSLDDPSTSASASTSKPTAAVRFQSPSIPNQSQSQSSASPKSNPISLGPNSIPSVNPSNPTPAPAAPVKGKAGWPKGKPRGPKNASSTSNAKSKSSSASSSSRANAQAAKEQAAAAQAQREAEAAARELEQKQRLELEALKDANPYGDEEEDTKLYCICKTLYDESKMMIACDTCDEWYHVECMGISERQAELIDMFICLNCETETQKTTYKPPCLRPDCTRAALPPLSRYCSERCGLLMASARILKTKYAGKDSEEYGGIERLLSGRVKTARRTEGIVTWGNDGGLTTFKKEDENENEKETKHQDSELIDGEMTKIEEKEDKAEEKEKENKVEEKEKSKEKEVPTVGQEWFGKFSDCWGSEDRKANEVIQINDFQESSFENEFLKNVKKLSLNVDGVDRNLLNNLFPISTISESNSSPMKEIQDTINSNPSNSSDLNDHQNSKLTISSTKSQEELLILRKRLLTLLKRKEKVNLDLDSIQARYKLLQLAEDRLSNLEPVKISEETTSSSSSSNKKGKKGGKPKKDSTKEKETSSTTNTEIKITTGPPCGYDSRLNWDEERFFNWSKSQEGIGILNESLELDGQLKDDWDDVVEVEDDENGDQRIEKGDSAFVCNTAKRKCKKHTDWSMVRGADFEVEKEVQTNLLSQISLDLSSLRDRINTLTDLIAEEKKSLVIEEEQQKQFGLEQEQREKEKRDEELARTLENEGKRQRG